MTYELTGIYLLVYICVLYIFHILERVTSVMTHKPACVNMNYQMCFAKK